MNGNPPIKYGPLITFGVLSLGFSILGVIFSSETTKGPVWVDHLKSGQTLLAGTFPENPTYPLWGYSFFAAIIGESLIWVQAALATIVATWWFSIVSRGAEHSGFPSGKRFAALVAFALLPWFMIATTYFSNSMAYILALAGVCLLWRAEMVAGWPKSLLISALIFGMASNIRSEFLLVSFLIAICILFSRSTAAGSSGWQPSVNASTFVVVVLATMIPWAMYSNASTGEYRLTSTNSAAVSYLGLGLLPGNPWGVVAKDEYVNKIAIDSVGSRNAWTPDAETHFRHLFREAITSEPMAYLRRIMYGWRVMLLQGMYIPNLRQAFASSKNDELTMSVSVERMKRYFSLSADLYKIDEAQRAGVELKALRIDHLVIIGIESLLRLLTMLLLIGMVSVLLVRLVAYWPYTFAGWTAMAFVIALFLISGLIQTSPRHSTSVLPIILGALLMDRRWIHEAAGIGKWLKDNRLRNVKCNSKFDV